MQDTDVRSLRVDIGALQKQIMDLKEKFSYEKASEVDFEIKKLRDAFQDVIAIHGCINDLENMYRRCCESHSRLAARLDKIEDKQNK